MSFSNDVKDELCRELVSSRSLAAAECYGVLLFCNTFSNRGIRIITGSRSFAAALPKLFHRAFGVRFDAIPEDRGRGKLSFRLTDGAQLRKIADALDYDLSTSVAHHINLGLLEEEHTREYFVRGAFLAGGSVTDPRKRYHMEFVTDHYGVSGGLYTLLFDMGFEPKTIARKGNNITYFKQSETIADLLTTIGAPLAAMEIMSAKIEKGMTNIVNRKVNCDTANVTKTVEAAAEQLDAIRRLREQGVLERLPDKLRQTASLREENPELSMAELAASFDPPITKSCLNHRLRKLAQIAAAGTIE